MAKLEKMAVLAFARFETSLIRVLSGERRLDRKQGKRQRTETYTYDSVAIVRLLWGPRPTIPPPFPHCRNVDSKK